MDNTLISEMISKAVAEEVLTALERKNFDFEKYISTISTAIATEVHQVLCKYGADKYRNEATDFQAIEEIVGIYEKYGFSGGTIHDF